MITLKNTLRFSISAALAAVLAAMLAGCAKQEPKTGEPPVAPESTTAAPVQTTTAETSPAPVEKTAAATSATTAETTAAPAETEPAETTTTTIESAEPTVTETTIPTEEPAESEEIAYTPEFIGGGGFVVKKTPDPTLFSIEGIPLTTRGGLTEPAKPTDKFKLPENAELTFHGDPETAERTTLPEGCYWTPIAFYPNAFTDPAGNLWLNRDRESVPYADRNMDNGYYDINKEYHFSQAEIDHSAAQDAQMHKNHEEHGNATIGADLTEEEQKHN